MHGGVTVIIGQEASVYIEGEGVPLCDGVVPGALV